MWTLARFGILGGILAVSAFGTAGVIFGFETGPTADWVAAATGGLGSAVIVKVLGVV